MYRYYTTQLAYNIQQNEDLKTDSCRWCDTMKNWTITKNVYCMLKTKLWRKVQYRLKEIREEKITMIEWSKWERVERWGRRATWERTKPKKTMSKESVKSTGR